MQVVSHGMSESIQAELSMPMEQAMGLAFADTVRVAVFF